MGQCRRNVSRNGSCRWTAIDATLTQDGPGAGPDRTFAKKQKRGIMNCKISIALATYNGSKYIQEQLRSISRQTTLPDELVVSDDGSIDDTLEIINRFAETAPFEIKVLPSHERLGFSDNFFNAASACRNEIIAFCDQDDVWKDTKLEHGVSSFDDDKVLLSMHTLIKTNGVLVPIGLHRQGITESKTFLPLELNPFATGWGNSMVFRKSLLDIFPVKQRPKQPSGNRPLSHDTWIYTLAAALGTVAHIDKPLLLYRQHGLNTMGTKKAPFIEKLSGALTASVGRYREIAEFYRSMYEIFERIAEKPGLFSPTAVPARDAFRLRMKRSQDRLDLYTGSSLWVRASAYSQLHFSGARDKLKQGDKSYLSMSKDVFVGILGVGRRDLSRK
jgi:glycosyltransferase involved in cell wall biosynthesis